MKVISKMPQTIIAANPKKLNLNSQTKSNIKTQPQIASAHDLYTRSLGYKVYELKDHLSNVRVVITDLKESTISGVQPQDFRATLTSLADYYPFRWIMPGRDNSSGSYRYGFNGMERDDDLKGEGNSYDFGARMLDSRLGRWLSVDPLMAEYSSFSPYNYVLNNPIRNIDPDGRDVIILGNSNGAGGVGHQAILVGNEEEVGFTLLKMVQKEVVVQLEIADIPLNIINP